MTRFWRVAALLSALCVALAALAGGAAAKPSGSKGKRKPTTTTLDQSFGRHGFATISVSQPQRPIRFAVSSAGRTYVLENSTLSAFKADGKPAREFGDDGRVEVTPTAGVGEGEPKALTVDSAGRILVTGSVFLGMQNVPTDQPGAFGYNPVNDAYVIRFNPDGSRDTTFGSNGEVVTNFGVPRPTGEPGKGVEYEKQSVEPSSIVVDSQGRPLIGGGYVSSIRSCGYIGGVPAPFVGRLTSAGALDTSFAGKGYTALAQEGRVDALAESPAGGPVTISSGQSCGARTEPTESVFSAFTEAGMPSPALDPSRPSFRMGSAIAMDSKGRALVLQSFGPFVNRGPALVRLLPSGAVDTTFGHGGGVLLGEQVIHAGAFTVDAKDRPILAGGVKRIELMRLKTNGKIDTRFAPHGLVKAGGGSSSGEIAATALDGQGRIYTARSVEGPTLKTGHGIQITRFLPTN